MSCTPKATVDHSGAETQPSASIGRTGERANATQHLRALLVSYAFPPVGGAGVQRTVKLLKFLGDFGIEGSVLTVGNPSVPLRDDTLGRDVPAGTSIYRARTFEPSYAAKRAAWSEAGAAASDQRLELRLKRRVAGLARQVLLPDPQVLWVPAAAVALRRVLGAANAPQVVLISAPPFSQFLLGAVARAHRGVGVVLDYRDEWSTARTSYEMLRGTVADMVGGALERALVPAAHVLTTATQEFRDHLLERFAGVRSERIKVITNGFDPDDFPHPLPVPTGDKWVLSYAGTVFKLTSAQGLLAAVRLLHRDSPQLGALLELRFMGRVVETEQRYFEGMDELGVKQLGYVPHEQLAARLAESHETLCLLDAVAGVERIYPAKIFELMYLRRPVLTLAPEGALTHLVRLHHLGTILAPRDEQAIASYLAKRLEEFARAPHVLRQSGMSEEALSRFHRRNLAGEFAAAMRQAVQLAIEE
jgi:glycosyltransferase involved in cell wall biosynthesis